MYDISQLNDMLVPELKDIADQLSIPHALKTDKKDLIHKILDRQSLGDGVNKDAVPERRKRKRIAKTNTPASAGDVEVMPEAKPDVEEEPKKESLKTQDQSVAASQSSKKMNLN
jgi:transcription termination factor Rho